MAVIIWSMVYPDHTNICKKIKKTIISLSISILVKQYSDQKAFVFLRIKKFNFWVSKPVQKDEKKHQQT